MKKNIEVLQQIQEIFRRELQEPALILTPESNANSIEKWDSINNLVLISSMEDVFNLTFPIEIIFDAKNVGDLCDYIVLNSENGG